MPKTHQYIPIHGEQWSWTANHLFVYVHDQDGNHRFTISAQEPTQALIIACIESFKDGLVVGHKCGAAEKAAHIRAALEIR